MIAFIVYYWTHFWFWVADHHLTVELVVLGGGGVIVMGLCIWSACMDDAPIEWQEEKELFK